jgi:cytochrome oxidase Cu insertion factor (SCO1/SenC/PrrC family)
MKRFGLFLGGVVLLLASPAVSAPAQTKQPWIGNPAPSFSLPTLDGKRLSLSDLRGQFVVLHFGAGW